MTHKTDSAAVAAGTPPRRLTCSCCGASTQGRQWHDQDTGWGLCTSCIPLILKSYTEIELCDLYGVRGVHFDLSSPAHDPFNTDGDDVSGRPRECSGHTFESVERAFADIRRIHKNFCDLQDESLEIKDQMRDRCGA